MREYGKIYYFLRGYNAFFANVKIFGRFVRKIFENLSQLTERQGVRMFRDFSRAYVSRSKLQVLSLGYENRLAQSSVRIGNSCVYLKVGGRCYRASQKFLGRLVPNDSVFRVRTCRVEEKISTKNVIAFGII